jgi:hypothetical protein
MKTVIFEKKYGVDINDFHSLHEIDEFIEQREGRKLRVIKIDSNVL